MLDFRVETFLAVCRHMNFTKAARELSITQPAVSHHIRYLEQAYGAVLFRHNGKRLQLTEAGEILRRTLLTMKHDEQHLQKRMQQAATGTRDYSFGATLSVAEFMLNEALGRFLHLHPDSRIRMQVADTKVLLSKLDSGELDCLVILGGNGTQKTANLLREEGLNVIHLPKTIDNDIYGTDITFGFYSAINVACAAIDCIHTTAASHNRVFIVEVMGHKVGWLTLYAGVASGADIILLPEIPYDIDKVIEAIDKRTRDGKGFTILAVAEGAISKEDAALSKKEYKEKLKNYKYPSVSYEIADQIEKRSGTEVRVTVPGHTQRGGSPCPYDRALCTRLGAAAAQAIIDEDYGYMIAMINDKTKRVPLKDVAGKLKTVDPGCQMIKEAKTIGISFGD